MRKISIHQLGYFPWLGFFDKMRQVDTFVFFDDVQYEKNYFDNRNKIKTANGWMWLTVPVKYRHEQKHNEVRIENNLPWRDKHKRAITINYARAPYFKDYFPFFEDIYNQEWEKIADLNYAIIKFIVHHFNLKCELVFSSDLKAEGKKVEKIFNICKLLKADFYLSGPFGRNYLDEELFRKNNIEVEYQNFIHPIYHQLFGDFIPAMGAIDLLMNHGPESYNILAHQK